MLCSPFVNLLEDENAPRSLQCLGPRFYPNDPSHEFVTHLVDQLLHFLGGAEELTNIREGFLCKQIFGVPNVRLGHQVLVVRASVLRPVNTFDNVLGRSFIHVDPVGNLTILQRMVTKPVSIVRQIVAPLSHTESD